MYRSDVFVTPFFEQSNGASFHSRLRFDLAVPVVVVVTVRRRKLDYRRSIYIVRSRLYGLIVWKIDNGE